MHTVAIVQSRFGSSRLPGKAVQVIAGRALLAHVLERAKLIRGVDRIILATTENPRDDQLVALARKCGRIDVYRGDEHDVLSRFRAIVDRYAPKVVIRLTGDCPLLDPRICERILENYRTGAPVALVHSATSPAGHYPDGLDVEVMSAIAVLAADRHARTAADREHVTRWIRRHLPVRALECEEDLSAMKLSVDTVEDLARVRQLFGFLPAGVTSLEVTVRAYRLAFSTAEATVRA